jgi:hypothetical protein
MQNFPWHMGNFSSLFPGLEVGSEWMDGILLDDKRMKLDLDELFLPNLMNAFWMKMDVLWSFGCMNFVDLNEQKEWMKFS